MVKGRQPLSERSVSITLVLTEPQKQELQRRARKKSKDSGRFVSISQIVRQAVQLYLAADIFFDKDIA